MVSLTNHDHMPTKVWIDFKLSTNKKIQGGAPVRERVQLVYVSTISLGLIRGLYRTSYWDYKPTNITGGAPPCMNGILAANPHWIGCLNSLIF